MDERSLRELQSAWRMARSAGADAREEAWRALYWLRRIPKAAVCWLTGTHRWSGWRESQTIVVPPENRWCRRCGLTEYRGSWPAIRTEGGSLRQPPSPNARWPWP